MQNRNSGDHFGYLPPGAVKLHGPLGTMLDKVVENRLKKVDYKQLVDPFRFRNENDGMWRCEFWGKVVRSAIYAWRSTQDAELKTIIDNTVADMLSTQTGDGCISSYPTEKQLNGWDIWGRKYVLLALLAYHNEMNPDPEIVEKMRLCCRQMISAAGNLMNYGQHFGMAASSVLRALVGCAVLSGDQEIMDTAKKLAESGCCYLHNIFTGASIGAAPAELGNGKSYEMTSCFQGLGALYALDNDPSKLDILQKYYRQVREKEIFITGGGGLKDANGEFWYNGSARQIRTDCGGMGETCVTATWLWFSDLILRITADSTVADSMERSFYNAMLGAFTDDGSNVTHINPFLTGGWKRQSGDQIRNFPGHDCCRAQGPYGLSLAPMFAVMESDCGYVINLYENMTVADVFEISGGYPSADKAVITLLADGEFELALRIPGDFGCRIDGKDIPGGSYHRIKRRWKAGEKLEIEFDCSERTVAVGDRQAKLCGALVMCEESGAAEGRTVVFRSGEAIDYASAGKKFSSENTLTVFR